MVHVTPTQDETRSHVFCDVDWWGDEVPSDQAHDIAVAHETSEAHIEAEIALEAAEFLAEAISAARGY
jgi:hypothetical protein